MRIGGGIWFGLYYYAGVVDVNARNERETTARFGDYLPRRVILGNGQQQLQPNSK